MRDKLNLSSLTKVTKKDLKETKGGLPVHGYCLCNLFYDNTSDNEYWKVIT